MAYKRVLKTANGFLESCVRAVKIDGNVKANKNILRVDTIQKWQPSRPDTSNKYGLSIKVDKKSGVISISGVTTEKNTISLANQIYVKEHKYLARSGLKGFGTINNRNEPHFFLNYAYSGQEYNKPIIFTSNYDGATYNLLYFSAGVEVKQMIIRPQLYDLTEIFGAGKEPETVEEAEAILGKDYIPYQYL